MTHVAVDQQFELRTHRSIAEIGEAEWNSLLGDSGAPSLRYEFLEALETTQCVCADEGWLPSHLTLRQGDRVLAAAPAYLKGHSSGEFVFDHSWANFSHHQLGQPYYPKLVIAVPFTPATGPRVLLAPGVSLQSVVPALVTGVKGLCERGELSGAHVLFPPAQEISELVAAGMHARHGIQYHWTNAGYQTFEDFLSRFSSKRRHQIRRERRALQEQNIELVTFTGEQITSAVVDHVFEFYRSTVEKHFYGQQYLNRAFFEELARRMSDSLFVVLARERGRQEYLAGAFNLLGSGGMFGRYWGARAEIPFLHFNVCYYRGIEECIARELPLFEPGAGGEHKVARGFVPTITCSAHYIREPILARAVIDFLGRERDAVERHLQAEKPLLKVL